MSGKRNGVSLEISICDTWVKVLGSIDLSHVCTEGSDLAVGSAEWGVSVSGNDKDGLGES
jgi:hypothetical protein